MVGDGGSEGANRKDEFAKHEQRDGLKALLKNPSLINSLLLVVVISRCDSKRAFVACKYDLRYFSSFYERSNLV